jgi:hypothetical protein
LRERVIKLTGTYIEHWFFRTMYGAQGSGKSTVCRELGAKLLERKWQLAYCDAKDQPHPRGAVRVRDVDHFIKIAKGDFRRWAFIHAEAHREDVACKGKAHPFLLERAHEYRHGGPCILLATQFAYEMELVIRRAAKDGSYLLYMGTPANLEFLKRNFEAWVFDKVSAWKDPKLTKEIRCIGPVIDGGSS